MEEDSIASGRILRRGDSLPAGLDHQNHPRVEDGDVAVVAFEGGDGGLVGGGDRIESFPGLDGVAEHGSLSGSVLFVSLCGFVSGCLRFCSLRGLTTVGG